MVGTRQLEVLELIPLFTQVGVDASRQLDRHVDIFIALNHEHGDIARNREKLVVLFEALSPGDTRQLRVARTYVPPGFETVVAKDNGIRHDTTPEKLAGLAREGVEHACLTIWSEDGDEILRKLDEFQQIAEQARALI